MTQTETEVVWTQTEVTSHPSTKIQSEKTWTQTEVTSHPSTMTQTEVLGPDRGGVDPDRGGVDPDRGPWPRLTCGQLSQTELLQLSDQSASDSGRHGSFVFTVAVPSDRTVPIRLNPEQDSCTCAL
ncbi:uncharacterized protein V6R79_002580 [Siganus canaliculatus]